MAFAGDGNNDPYHDGALLGKSQDERLKMANPAGIPILGVSYDLRVNKIGEDFVFYAPSPMKYNDKETFLAFARKPKRLVTTTDCLKNIVGAGSFVSLEQSRGKFLFAGAFRDCDDAGWNALLFNTQREVFLERTLRVVRIPRTSMTVSKELIDRMKFLLPAYLDAQNITERTPSSDSDGELQLENTIQQSSTSSLIHDSDSDSLDGRNARRSCRILKQRQGQLEAQQKEKELEKLRQKKLEADEKEKRAAEKAEAEKAAAEEVAAAAERKRKKSEQNKRYRQKKQKGDEDGSESGRTGRNQPQQPSRLESPMHPSTETHEGKDQPTDDREKFEGQTAFHEEMAGIRKQLHAQAAQLTQLLQTNAELVKNEKSSRIALQQETKRREDAENQLMSEKQET